MVLFHAANAPGGVYLGLFLNRDLHAPERLLAYAFVVSMAAWMLVVWPAGRLADRWGRRPLLIAGWGVMGLRLALVAVAHSYVRFAARLAPVAVIGLVLNFAVVVLLSRKSLGRAGGAPPPAGESTPTRVHRGLLIKSIAVTAATVGLFFSGQPIALVALAAAGVLMLSRIRPEKVYTRVDWPILVMFIGLFVVVHAFEVHVVRTWGLERCDALRRSPVVLVSGLSVLLSNLVSNVPAVLLFKPLMEVIPQKELAWLALAMSSTLAGNLTVLGSVANLIVVENARRAGTELGFLEYLKVGVPLTVLTITVGVAWLALARY
jgi:Na+/H+ antiporter NhaD/arsenite permease-like protein